MKKIVFLIAISAFIACKNEKKKEVTTESTVKTETVKKEVMEAKNEVFGKYYGVLPCASCPGIETTLVLNKDFTFELTQKFQEQKENDTEVSTGKFVLEGNKFSLETKPKMSFSVDTNSVFLLNAEGKKVEGELANKYKLARQ